MTLFKQLEKNVSKGNARLFIALLLITSGIWMIIQLSKTYTTEASIKLRVKNIPIDRVLDHELMEVEHEVTASGFKLLWLNLKSNNLDIEMKEFKITDDAYRLGNDKIRSILSEKYLIDGKNISFKEDEIVVNYSKREVKYVRIKPNINYSFATGYNTVDSIQVIPDSVKISGEKQNVDKIDHLETESLQLENIDDTLDQKVNLKVPGNKINMGKNKVKLYLPVQKFTEDEKVVPVEMINVPDSLQVNYFPKNVSINYLIPISRYNKIQIDQFKVQCDFSEKFTKQGIMIPELVERPRNIKNVSIKPYKIEYLIKK